MKYFIPMPETLEELKKLYKKLSFKHHPDCGGNNDDMKIVNAEYTALFEKLKDIHTKDKINVGKLKPYLDSIGKMSYICIYNGFNKFLCEGTTEQLRDNPLWRLIDEENTDVAHSYLGQSESSEESIIIVLHLYPTAI